MVDEREASSLSDDASRAAFRREILELQHTAEAAFVRGDAGPRIESWSHADPVSLFAALGPTKAGWHELEPMFRQVAERLAGGRDVEFELVAFDVADDMAWTAGFLRFTVSLDSAKPRPMNLRITHIYRRERGRWRIAHEHSNWETA